MDDMVVMLMMEMGLTEEDAEREVEAYYEEMGEDEALEEMYPAYCWDEGVY